MSGVGAPDNKCEICESAAEFGQDWAVRLRKCPRCGTFLYHGTMDYASKQGWPSVKTPDHMVRLSGWVRDQNDAGVEYPNITLEVSLRVAQMQLPGLRDRANRALGVIAARWPSLDSYSAMQGIAQLPEVQGRSYSATLSDAMILVRLLTSEGLLDLEKMGQAAVKMSIKGLLAVEALGASLSASPQGFVAMSFDERLREVWTNGFDPAIRAAGFTPFRIDSKEFLGGISDEIIAEIRRSRFVVADYTHQKAGVYFEAGFALGMGLTVIPTCRADEISGLHFDIRHLNTLTWERPEGLVNTLSNRIRAIVGTGPLVAEEA